ncbi:MAG: hypothetical protein ACK57U_12295 [Planctomycetota bacterium]
MNFFAHSLPFLDDPWVVAGVCLPDWMSVINRRVRLRSKKVQPRTDDPDSATARVARGVVQHHADDEWFHETPEFALLNLDFSIELRQEVRLDDSLRTRFVGHILIEMLLDDWLSQSYPGKLEEYYRLLEQLPEDQLERIVADLAGVNPAAVELPVGRFLPRFRRERFLFDYRDDERLLFRLNQVMSRVRLSALPDSMMGWLPSARKRVDELAPRLLCGFRWPLEMVV